MSKSTLAFIAFCVVAIALELLEYYGLLHWYESEDRALSVLLVGNLVLFAILVIWSLVSVRRQKIRAIVGGLVSGYCLCNLFSRTVLIP